MLHERCEVNSNFKFICNDNILYNDIDATDQIHPLESGNIKLANNILNSLNGLN